MGVLWCGCAEGVLSECDVLWVPPSGAALAVLCVRTLQAERE